MDRTKDSPDDDILESQNRYMTEQLSKKISQLRGAAYDIEIETKEHNRLLDSMGNDFDSGQGFLSGSYGRMNKMLSTGGKNRRVMCYISLFLVGMFVIIYYLLAKVSR